MSFRAATGLAVFGSVLIMLIQLFYLINSLIGVYNFSLFGINFPNYIINAIYFIGSVCLLVFFSSLYNKQKH